MSEKISFFRGDDVSFGLELLQDNGQPFNLTGCTLYFSARRSFTASSYAIDIVITEHVDAAAGRTTIIIPSAETDALPGGKYLADIRLKNAEGKLVTIGVLNLTLKDNVTRVAP